MCIRDRLKGIEMNSGSLGHGLPVAVGMALAGKMDGRDYRVYTIMGDGELAEGSVWEGAMSGGNYQLDNLCALVDRNRLQMCIRDSCKGFCRVGHCPQVRRFGRSR